MSVQVEKVLKLGPLEEHDNERALFRQLQFAFTILQVPTVGRL